MDIAEMMNNTVSQIRQEVKDPPNTYRKDGVLYCSKCDKPLESVKHNSIGEELRIRISCKCPRWAITLTDEESEERARAWAQKVEQQEREREERYEEERRRSLAKRKQTAFDDVRLKDWTFEHDDNKNVKISSIAKKYTDNFGIMRGRSKGLLLYGGVGTGKSFIAACIANDVMEQGYGCKFTNFSRLANTLVACEFGEKQGQIDALTRYPLLIIDDLGSERNTEFMNDIVYSVIDARHKSGEPLIVTTNLTGEQLKHPKDIHSERIFSRLFEMCIPVEVKGEDRRKRKLRDDDRDLRELLGI